MKGLGRPLDRPLHHLKVKEKVKVKVEVKVEVKVKVKVRVKVEVKSLGRPSDRPLHHLKVSSVKHLFHFSPTILASFQCNVITLPKHIQTKSIKSTSNVKVKVKK